ncbi:MAG TPA: iron-sulfur cluster biosynthesis family protein [Miltoncostaeaceae bacterium]|nr:iron-sulfur cluster biosynthesis family protein [Miltoncostaeaceae bacterium]
MLTLTPTAESAIREIIATAPVGEGGGLRISTDPGSDGGVGFRLALVEAPEPRDRVVEDVAVPVYVEPEAAPLLDDGVLDATVEDERVTFTVGPRA